MVAIFSDPQTESVNLRLSSALWTVLYKKSYKVTNIKSYFMMFSFLFF